MNEVLLVIQLLEAFASVKNILNQESYGDELGDR
jgi:hypothetical protein